MPPKKGKKMALNDFLVDETLGSWADEMESLPTAPALKTDEDRYNNRDNRRDFSSRDREYLSRESGYPPREELPLPNKPPYIAFVGNLAFDIYDGAIVEYFSPSPIKDIKIIKDRDDKPKGFGYVEFETLDGLKDALTRTGGQLANRTVRVSVAEPPKERTGAFADDRFEGPWRRQGPLPPLPGPSESRRPSGGFSGRDREGPEEGGPPSAAETTSDWRANRRGPLPPPPERPGAAPRRPSAPTFDAAHPAHSEQTWSIGSKFKPSEPSPGPPASQEKRNLFGSNRTDAAAPSANPDELDNWRMKRTVSQTGSTRGSPTTSNPPTPQLGGRRKLELLPRGVSNPAVESPLSSPRSANAIATKSSPFGAAKPIDVSSREKEVEERLEQERAARAATAAKEKDAPRFGPARGSKTETKPTSPKMAGSPPKLAGSGLDYTPNSPKMTGLSIEYTASSPKMVDADLEQRPASPQTAGAEVPTTAQALKKEFPVSYGAVRPKFSFAAAASGGQGRWGNAATSAVGSGPSTTHAEDQASQSATSDAGVNKITEQVAEVSI